MPHYAAWHSLFLSRGGFSYITFTFGLLTFTFNKVHLREVWRSQTLPQNVNRMPCPASLLIGHNPQATAIMSPGVRQPLKLPKVTTGCSWTCRRCGLVGTLQILRSTALELVFSRMVLSEIDNETSCACSRTQVTHDMLHPGSAFTHTCNWLYSHH